MGWRHLGMPWSGAADPLSMALANRLVGNPADETSVEITYGGFEAICVAPCWIGVTGAPARLTINNSSVRPHQTLKLELGDRLHIYHAERGMRIYLSASGGFICPFVMGSTSTYLPAEIGGHEGRRLVGDDILTVPPQPDDLPIIDTPSELAAPPPTHVTMRATASAEVGQLTPDARAQVFDGVFTIGRQASRMGVRLDGIELETTADGQMNSAATFPGTIQCPENGSPILLLCDAQTTGGYPRIAQVIRADRHLLGQLRPGMTVSFIERSPDLARTEYTDKTRYLRQWLPDFTLI